MISEKELQELKVVGTLANCNPGFFKLLQPA